MGLLVGGLGVASVALIVAVVALATGGSDDSSASSTAGAMSSPAGAESCPTITAAGDKGRIVLADSGLDCLEAKQIQGAFDSAISREGGRDAVVGQVWDCEAVPLAGYPIVLGCRTKDGRHLEVRSIAPYSVGDAAEARPDDDSPPIRSRLPRPAAFETPSGNITCVISAEAVHCEIIHKTYTPYVPKPPSCHLDYGHRVSVGAYGSSEFDCYGDSMMGLATSTLRYGREVRRGRIGCLSQEAGLTCETVSGTGFFLSVAAVKLL